MFKSITARAGAAVAAGALIFTGAGTALAAVPNATNACGASCIDISFVSPGHHGILGSAQLAGNANTYVNLVQSSNGDPRQDFTPTVSGTVAPQWCKANGSAQSGSVFTDHQCALLKTAGLLASTTFEVAYNPDNGGPETECVGDWHGQSPIPNGYRARLADCGVTAATVMIVATALPGVHAPAGDFWLVSGGSNNSSRPQVLTGTGSNAFPQPLKWETVQINGSTGVNDQLVRAVAGPA